MTFIALFRNPSISLATDQLVLGADEVQPLKSTIDMAHRMTQQLEEIEQELSKIKQHAYDEAFVAGKAAGIQAGKEEIAATLTDIMVTSHHQRLALQGSVARLATQVVRKVAGEIGAPGVVAGLAKTAASDLAPGTSLKLWVHPTVFDSVNKQVKTMILAQQGQSIHADVRIDEAIDPFDCILNTNCGHIIASLDEQLKRLETALSKELSLTISGDK